MLDMTPLHTRLADVPNDIELLLRWDIDEALFTHLIENNHSLAFHPDVISRALQHDPSNIYHILEETECTDAQIRLQIRRCAELYPFLYRDLDPDCELGKFIRSAGTARYYLECHPDCAVFDMPPQATELLWTLEAENRPWLSVWMWFNDDCYPREYWPVAIARADEFMVQWIVQRVIEAGAPPKSAPIRLPRNRKLARWQLQSLIRQRRNAFWRAIMYE